MSFVGMGFGGSLGCGLLRFDLGLDLHHLLGLGCEGSKYLGQLRWGLEYRYGSNSGGNSMFWCWGGCNGRRPGGVLNESGRRLESVLVYFFIRGVRRHRGSRG